MTLQSTKWIGKQRLHFEEITSTNKMAKELADMGYAHGTLVTADAQTAGIGRRGRSWSSEKGEGIYMSVLLRPKFMPNQAPMLTLVAALAVARAITDYFENSILERHSTSIGDFMVKGDNGAHQEDAFVYCKKNAQKKIDGKIVGKNLPCKIKWPNDIVINGKKICGILTEMILNQTQIDAVIIGIGINVSNTCFSDEISCTASSLYLETGLKWEKEQLLEEIWKWFEIYYASFLNTGDLSSLKSEYEAFLVNKNEKVKVLDPHGAYTGMAKGITNTGELLVNTSKGVKTVDSGEVSVRGIYGYV